MIEFFDRHRLASWTAFYILLAVLLLQALGLRDADLPFEGSPFRLLINSIPAFLLTVFVVPLSYVSSIAWRQRRGLAPSPLRFGRTMAVAMSGLIALAWVGFLAWLISKGPAA